MKFCEMCGKWYKASEMYAEGFCIHCKEEEDDWEVCYD